MWPGRSVLILYVFRSQIYDTEQRLFHPPSVTKKKEDTKEKQKRRREKKSTKRPNINVIHRKNERKERKEKKHELTLSVLSLLALTNILESALHANL